MKIAVRRTPSTIQKRTDELSWSRMRLVAPTGTTKKRPTARASDSATVRPHVRPPIGSSSPGSDTWALAEIASARKPILSDSARATTPRMTGTRKTRCRFAHDTSGSEVTSISPIVPSGAPSSTGRRTATAHVDTPRIITPSRTAWPPTGASRSATGSPSGIGSAWTWGCVSPATAALSAGAVAFDATLIRAYLRSPASGAAPESLDASAGVDELLLAGVERMAGRTDLDVELGLGRARVELVPARAPDVREDVVGMDSGLHDIDVSDGPRPRTQAHRGGC